MMRALLIASVLNFFLATQAGAQIGVRGWHRAELEDYLPPDIRDHSLYFCAVDFKEFLIRPYEPAAELRVISPIAEKDESKIRFTVRDHERKIDLLPRQDQSATDIISTVRVMGYFEVTSPNDRPFSGQTLDLEFVDNSATKRSWLTVSFGQGGERKVVFDKIPCHAVGTIPGGWQTIANDERPERVFKKDDTAVESIACAIDYHEFYLQPQQGKIWFRSGGEQVRQVDSYWRLAPLIVEPDKEKPLTVFAANLINEDGYDRLVFTIVAPVAGAIDLSLRRLADPARGVEARDYNNVPCRSYSDLPVTAIDVVNEWWF